MQKDNIKNAKKYYALSDNIKIGLKYLEENDFTQIENGKYEIADKKVYAIVQEYQSKFDEEAKFEAHKKYTDIQYVVSGEERIGFCDIGNFQEDIPYSEEKDIVFLSEKDKDKLKYIKLEQNEFAIFTPDDAHKPSLAVKEPGKVKKVVVKVLT